MLYFILLVMGLLIALEIYKRHTHLLYKLPGPPSVPILGHVLIAIQTYHGMWTTIRNTLNNYYPSVCLWIFTIPIVLIRHPDDIQILLKSKTNLEKADLYYRCLKKLELGGIITSGGKKWHNHRKLMNQAFHRNFLKSTANSANKFAELLVEQMLQLEDDSIQNVLPLSMKYSLQVICGSAMAYDLQTVGAPYEEEYREAFEGVMDAVVYRCLRNLVNDWILKFLPLGRDQTKYINIVSAFTKRIIEERRKYHAANGTLLSGDFLDDFENVTDLEDTKVKSSKDLNLLDSFLIFNAKGLINEAGMSEEIETIVAAAYDTTGYAITHALLVLAENEKEQNLARIEVTDVMKKYDGKLPISEVQNLQYLDRCMKEALRLFPSVPLAGRKLEEDTQFTKYVIPRNTDVFMCIYDLHRDPNFWPEPYRFNPDRFLPEFSKNRHPYAYLPFSSGLRNCIGQKHAMIEMKILIAHILYNFYLKPIDFTHNILYDVKITLKPSTDKLRVKFIKIL